VSTYFRTSQGEQRGIELGMEKGIEKGMEKGMEKGIEKTRLAIARTMVTKGYDIKSIQEITELAKEMIDSLKKGNSSST